MDAPIIYSSMFFTYETALPDDVGYGLFDKTHITIILLCILMVAMLVILYVKSAPAFKGTILRIIGSIPPVLTLLRILYVVCCGESVKYELPLHLCSLAGILCFIHIFYKGFIGQILYALCLPGAILAIVFPNGNNYPAFHFITIESYLFHSLIIAYVITQLTDRTITPRVRDSYKSILFLAVTVPIVYFLNRVLGTNYMFLMGPSAGSPLSGAYHSLGYAGYMAVFCVLTVAVIFINNMIGQTAHKVFSHYTSV